MYRDPLEKILYAKRNLYAFRVKSRNFLHWCGLSRNDIRAIPHAARRSACGTDVSATSWLRVEAPRRFLKTLCFYICKKGLLPRQAFRSRIPRNSEMRLRSFSSETRLEFFYLTVWSTCYIVRSIGHVSRYRRICVVWYYYAIILILIININILIFFAKTFSVTAQARFFICL